MTIRLKTKTYCQTIVMWCLIAAVFFSSMGAGFLSFRLIIGQMTMFRLFFLLSLVMTLFFGNSDSAFFVKLWEKNNRMSIFFFLLWGGYAGFSIIWAKDIVGYIRTLFFLLTGILVVLLLNAVCRKDDIKGVIVSLITGFLIQGIIGIYEVITSDYRYMTKESILSYQSKDLHYPVAMMGNSNNFATGMYLGGILAIYLLLGEKRRINKMYLFFVILTFVGLITISGSRAVLMGLIMASMFTIFMRQKRKQRFFLIMLTCFALIVIMPRLIPYINLDYYTTRGESFSVRKNLIKNGLVFLMDTYGLGVGNGQIEYWMRNNAVHSINNVENMHNWWAEIITAYGVVIFVGFIAFYFKLICDYIKTYERQKRTTHGKQMLIMAGGIVGLFMALISSSSNISAEYVWVFWGICIVLQRDKESRYEWKSLEKNRILYQGEHK